jgi:hypothetical protein
VFHVELRQFPHTTHALNLTEEELETRIVGPWVRRVPVEWGDRRWAPERAKLTIYEGEELRPEDIGMGRGWQNARRGAENVTARVLAKADSVGPFKDAVCATTPVGLPTILAMSHERYPGRRVSERLALAEQAVWELLHDGKVTMVRGDEEVAREEWQTTLLTWSAWVDETQPVLLTA